jgi:tetratricopeptide (TPR) repeat protein
VQRALLAELGREAPPTVLVVEDLHWADEATIDVLTFACRRIAEVPAVIVLTYRDAEVVGSHALMPLLGNLPVALTRRIALTPLSTTAVAELVGRDRADEVVAVTGGVPFFVTELAAMGSENPGEQLPTSVAHAVLARVAKLPTETAPLLDLLAVEPSRTDVALLDALRPSWMTDIEPAERSAIVTLQAHSVAFRHELARRAVLDAVPAARRRVLHREVAHALVTTNADPARVVHHAEAGGDFELLAEQALLAARQASSVSAHREAWSHYQRAVPLLRLVEGEDRGEVLEAASHEAYAAADAGAALSLALDALDEQRRAGNEVAAGRLHRWLSRIHWYQGRRLQSEVQAQLAVKALEPLAPSVELAWAYSNLAQLAMLAWRFDEAVLWGERSLELARQLGDDEVLVHALINVTTVSILRDPTEDHPLWEAVEMAKALGQHHEATRGTINVAFTLMEYDLPGPAREISERAVLYAEQHEVETLRQYIVAMLGRIAALEGRWDEAEAVLREAVASGSSVPLILALTALALLQVRRGDDESEATLERTWPLVEAAGEPQRIVPLVEVEAERAWLAGRLDESVRHLRDGYALIERVGRRHGRLARWLQEAGLLVEVPPGVSEPHLAELEGRWADAAAMWRERGMPYEEAMALARTGEAGRREAIEIAERLGAAPLLQRLRAAPVA